MLFISRFFIILKYFITRRVDEKFSFLSFLVASLASFSFAADLLASLTNGKISDNSPGVKVLSLEEAKQVKGGYLYYDTEINYI
ncbi:hypothetical protein PTQ35_06470 [Campylobacter sp. 46490-21]|uniref:hypothetical protein n=1 Tax=Campylobacter magnus TaxID=3026462 RepID=UPI00236165B1|nr:hypothetical protein [Campylobacter magnus]MDD0848451.1 hypothetical protein [Campylobacter magnus]